MFGVSILNEIWNIDLSSALVSMLMSLSNFFFSNKAHLNSSVRLLIGIVLCYSHQTCCLLCYLCEITNNNGIHIYLSRCNSGLGLKKNIGGSTDLAKKGSDRRICIHFLLRIIFLPRKRAQKNYFDRTTS